MKRYFNRFVREEDGMETIEFVVILAIVAGLIAIITSVGGTVKNKANGAKNEIEAGLANLPNGE